MTTPSTRRRVLVASVLLSLAAACGGARARPSYETIRWETTLAGATFPVGTELEFACPPNGASHSVWGTDTYSDDSSICTAAVHAGLITFAAGGRVRIVVAPGLERYFGSARNGVTTSAYEACGRSYSFVR